MLNIISIILLYVALCNCQIDNLLFYPIANTKYMLYMNKQGSSMTKSINSQSYTFETSQFWKNIDQQMTMGESLMVDNRQIKVSPSPVLPNHPEFCVRKIDENKKMVIEFDWSKDEATASDEYEVIIFNFKGDLIQRTTISRNGNEKQKYNTNSPPLTEGQVYTNKNDLNGHDLLVLVIRPHNRDTSRPDSPWAYHTVFPEDLNKMNKMSDQNKWSLEDIIKQQGGFMMMSVLHGDLDWENAAAPFAFFNYFSQVAALSESELQNKYFSALRIPKSARKEEKQAFTIKEVGQRIGAGMGINIWSTNGHHFSRKFYKHFVKNTALFKAFVKECFSYNQLLDGAIQHGQEVSSASNYRNKADYNAWSYTFDSSTLTGTRTMKDEEVVDIKWALKSSSDSDNWTTQQDGSIKA